MFGQSSRLPKILTLLLMVGLIGATMNAGFTNSSVAMAQDNGQICLSTDVGGRGDLSFNDMAFLGADQAAAEFDMELQVAQPSAESDYLPTLRQFARSGNCEIIIAVGFLLTDAVNQVAQEFPDQEFALIDAVADQPNVANFLFQEQQMSAMLGALGAMTAAHFDFPRVGIVLGVEIPVLWRFEAGYRFGISWGEDFYEQVTGEEADIDLAWTYTGTFSDIARGKSAAQAQYAQDAAVVYSVAGPLLNGVLEALREKLDQEGQDAGPPFMFGVDANNDYLGNGNKVLASGMKRVDRAAFEAVASVVNGTFEGRTRTLGLTDRGVAMSRFSELLDFIDFGLNAGAIEEENVEQIKQNWLEMRESVPQFIWTGVSELETRIISGEVVPPNPGNEDDIQAIREEYP